nr:Chain C, circadian clock protein KaiC [Thermosynechococcus vestitus BP-1]1SUY_D Chain D, circadian clock protein KaiC [Thermosynechococcus vestitus BP-1]1SV1_C Chain C, Circadian clock protein KaiC [Thermosynechococcus vestitus BP-1]1SV1_D Chain D, Circadian clock protein KaiC [Thermosynechococcus vestitus BP-1]
AMAGIISGTPTRISVDEKTELARIAKGMQDLESE